VIRLQIQSAPRFLRVLEGFLRAGTIDHCAKAITILEETGYRIRTADIVE
jgi:hypothetical protein